MSLNLPVFVIDDILLVTIGRRSPSLAVTRPPPTEHATSYWPTAMQTAAAPLLSPHP